jgi:hypothetical protein
MEKEIEVIGMSNTDKYKTQIDIWYKVYDIHHEKIELFYDFLSSFYNLLDETFLGEDVLYKDTDQLNHFNWCWDKTIDNFSKERILFKERGIHYEYFWIFFKEAYYYTKMESKEPLIREYFYKLFDFKHKKTRSELDLLTEIYKLLNQNFKN